MEGTSKSAYPPIDQDDTVHPSTKVRFRPILRWDAPSEKNCWIEFAGLHFQRLRTRIRACRQFPSPGLARRKMYALTAYPLYPLLGTAPSETGVGADLQNTCPLARRDQPPVTQYADEGYGACVEVDGMRSKPCGIK